MFLAFPIHTVQVCALYLVILSVDSEVSLIQRLKYMYVYVPVCWWLRSLCPYFRESSARGSTVTVLNMHISNRSPVLNRGLDSSVGIV